MLKHFVRVFVLAAFLITAAQSSVSAEEWIDCTFANNTGQTITELYFQPSSDTEWGQNFLSSPLLNGYYISASYVSGANYDVRIVFEDGSSLEYGQNYLEGATEIWFAYDDNGNITMYWN